MSGVKTTEPAECYGGGENTEHRIQNPRHLLQEFFATLRMPCPSGALGLTSGYGPKARTFLPEVAKILPATAVGVRKWATAGPGSGSLLRSWPFAGSSCSSAGAPPSTCQTEP